MLIDKIIFLICHKFKTNNITFTKKLENDKVMTEIYDDEKLIVKFDLLDLYENCFQHGNHFFTEFINKLKTHIEKNL